MRPRDRGLLVRLRESQKSDDGRPLSQRRLAKAIDIAHGHYADIEGGRRNPSYDVAERLATFHGTSVAALFEEEAVEFGAPTEEVPA